MSKDYCPKCEGEGCFVAEGPGCFDERFGNYYPTDLYIPCDRCGGTGEWEPKAELVCTFESNVRHTSEHFDFDEDELPL